MKKEGGEVSGTEVSKQEDGSLSGWKREAGKYKREGGKYKREGGNI